MFFGLIILASLATTSLCANILFIPLHITPSHKKSMVPIAEALGKQGHNVTIWQTDVVEESLKSRWFSDLYTYQEPNCGLLRQFKNKEDIKMRKVIFRQKFPIYDFQNIVPWYLNTMLCKGCLSQNRSDLFHILDSTKWDLLFLDPHFTSCAYVIGSYLKVPKIMLATTFFPYVTTDSQGLPTPFGTYPTIFHYGYENTAFRWRLGATYARFIAQAVNRIVEYMILFQTRNLNSGLSWQGFSLESFQGQTAFAFSVASQQVDFPRPQLNNVHFIGGTCASYSKKPLPKALEKFVNDKSSKGTILLAFGHMVRFSSLPEIVLPTFIETFKLLPEYRFIFQYGEEELKGLPSNVYTSDWLPQADILHHPKTSAFVSHTGYKSFLEAVCAEVPVVAMPVFGDQPRNALALEGFVRSSLSVNKHDITAEHLAEKIKMVAENPNFKDRARKTARYIQDTIRDASDLATFWVNFVLRHANDIDVLKSKGRHFGLLRFYCLDIITFLSFVLCAVLVILLYALQNLRQRCLNR